MAVMHATGVAVDVIRAVDFDLPPGVYPDMRDHGFAGDDWPAIVERVMAADILIIGTPIWLGEKSSVCTRVIERLYGNSAELNGAGQFKYYGRVGGCIVTGREGSPDRERSRAAGTSLAWQVSRYARASRAQVPLSTSHASNVHVSPRISG